jgi:hypothetical protein
VAPRELYHLDERFAVSDHSCTIASARERVTEAKAPSAGRPSADLRVLELSFRCQTRSQREISFERALPNDATVLLVSEAGSTKAPSTRTWLHTVAPERLFFELDENQHALAPPRRYDAKSGALKTSHRGPGFELWLSGSSLSTRVRLHKALDLLPVERSFDTLVAQLATGAGADPTLGEVRKLHQRALELTEAGTLQIDDVMAEGALRIVTCSYRDEARPFGRETLQLVLELTPTGPPEAPYQFARARELASLETSLRCAEQERRVQASARKAFAEADAQTAECNLAGVLWPAPCDAVPSAFVQEALEARTGCMGEAFAQLEARSEQIPADLQLTLRRGRSERALDRSPRYTLALFGSGATVFHAQRGAIATGRSDGRTSPRLLSALVRALDDLDWFERRGGEWGELCDPRADDAHVVTVHARERERMVMNRAGCRGPFSARELGELFDLVERVGFVSTWTSPRPDYADRAARIWTISAE